MMRVACIFCSVCFIFIPFSWGAAPDVSLEQAAWEYRGNATYQNGVLEIIGNSGEFPLELIIDGETYLGKYSLKSFSDKKLYLQNKYSVDDDPCKYTEGNGEVCLPAYSVSLVTLEDAR